MWPFKSKAKRQAEAEEIKKKILANIQERLDDAKNTADPAERFLKYEDIRLDVDVLTGKSKDELAIKARGKFHMAYLGVGTTTAFTLATIGMIVNAPLAIFFLLGIPGIYTGNWAGEKRVTKEMDKLMKEHKPFLDALEAKGKEAATAADIILANEITALATSARLGEIVKKAPRVRDHFTAAFARELAKRENPQNPPQKPPGGFKL